MATSEKRQSTTLRLPADLHERLRIHAFLTRKPINETAIEALEAYLEGKGREEMVQASTKRTQQTHRVALDKLRDL